MTKCRLCYSQAVNPHTGDRKGIEKYQDLCDVCFWKVQVHKFDCTKCKHNVGLFLASFCVRCLNNPTHQNYFELTKQ